MSQGDQNSSINQQEKEQMLDELESLSKMLDEEDEHLDEDEPAPIPEDIPILKSFVDDVPVLEDTLQDDAPEQQDQPNDSLDRNAGSFSTTPMSSSTSKASPRATPAVDTSKLDMSFLDKDPLEISDQVRNRTAPQAAPPTLEPEPPVVKPDVTPAPPAQVTPKADLQQKTAVEAKAPLETKPQVSTDQAKPAQPTPESSSPRAEQVTKPLDRFQASSGGENPFLPRSTLDKIRENHAREAGPSDDASAQLRKLLQENPLNKVSFDGGANSKEFRDLRQKASQMVNEVIRANMPRLEAELRMKLEQEVDRLFKDVKKNPS